MTKKIALYSAILALYGVGQCAFAHTGIKEKVFIEGQGNTGLSMSSAGVLSQSSAAYDDFTVGHGCATNLTPEVGTTAKQLNVIATAAVFPNSIDPADTIIYRYNTGSIVANIAGVDGTVLTGAATTLPVSSSTDLSDDIVGINAGAGFNTLGVGLVSPNLFGNAIVPTLDSLGNVRGYAAFNKAVALQESVISTTGLSSFKFTVPKFKATSCAKNLIVRVAVSNWCRTGNKTAPDRKDVWIGTDTGSTVYAMNGANHEVMPNSRTTLGLDPATGGDGIGNGKSFWPSFTVTRDTTNNPLPSSCGAGYDVVVEPKGTDIEKYLTISPAPFPAGSGLVFY